MLFQHFAILSQCYSKSTPRHVILSNNMYHSRTYTNRDHRPDLTKFMTRLVAPGKRLPNLKDEPNFYELAKEHPLPPDPAVDDAPLAYGQYPGYPPHAGIGGAHGPLPPQGVVAPGGYPPAPHLGMPPYGYPPHYPGYPPQGYPGYPPYGYPGVTPQGYPGQHPQQHLPQGYPGYPPMAPYPYGGHYPPYSTPPRGPHQYLEQPPWGRPGAPGTGTAGGGGAAPAASASVPSAKAAGGGMPNEQDTHAAWQNFMVGYYGSQFPSHREALPSADREALPSAEKSIRDTEDEDEEEEDDDEDRKPAAQSSATEAASSARAGGDAKAKTKEETEAAQNENDQSLLNDFASEYGSEFPPSNESD